MLSGPHSIIKLKPSLALATFAAAFLVLFTTAQAATLNDVGTASQGLQISPTLFQLNATAGANYILKLTVTNVTARPLAVSNSIDDFSVKDETGTPKILTAFEEKSLGPTVSFKDWVQPLSDVVIPAKSSKDMAFDVKIPANAEAGGHYGVIRFTGRPPEANPNVALIASLGSLVLVRVAGNITEHLDVASFYIAKNGQKNNLAQGGPIDIVTRLENTGNVHVAPSGLITIKNMLGSTSATLPFNPESGNVLPNSIRKFTNTYSRGFLFGRYSVSLSATYGTTGKTLSAAASFWIIPFKFIIIVLLALAVLAYLLRRGLRSYNRRIISRHTSAVTPPAKTATEKKIRTAKKKKVKTKKTKK